MTSAARPAAPERGLFIAVEGGDGAGKSTQVRMLAAWLATTGRPVRATREPGDTTMGPALRALLLDHGAAPTPRTEALLFAANRAQHVAEVIEPALRRGEHVVTDRYVDSSIAYQGAGRGLAEAEVEALNRWATGGLRPDLTVLLDVEPGQGLGRLGEAPDRLEAESLSFHRRVRRSFLERAAREPEMYLVLDAAGSPDSVAARIRGRVDELLGVRPAGGGR